MAQIVRKNLDWFKLKPQARKQFDETKLRQLGESLKERQLHPVVCLQDGTVISGEGRVRGAGLVNLKDLETKIIEDSISEAECRRLQLIENMQRQDLTGYEQWQGCVDLLRLNRSWTQKDLAERLQIDPSMVIRLLSPSKCIASVQAALAEGKIGISDCYVLCRLNEAEQAAALAMKLSGASRDDLARHARRQMNGDQPAVRTNRVKCELTGNVSVTVTGDALGFNEVIEALGDAHREARKARDQNLDVKTWAAVMRDRARKGS